MRWYKKAQAEKLQQMGIAPDLIQWVMSLPNDQRGFAVGALIQNPALTGQDVQNLIAQQQQQVDPYLPHEYEMAQRFPQQVQKWILVNLKQLRNSNLDPNINWKSPQIEADFPEYARQWGVLDYLTQGNQLRDFLNAYPNYRVDPFTIDEVAEDVHEWHEVMAGRGEGKIFAPTNPDLVVFGPDNWSNPEWKGWTIQEVRSENDLDVEGNKMGHCVGGYCHGVEKGELRIFSLRDPENTPHVTMEVDAKDYYFRQIQGNGPKSGNVDPGDQYKEMIGEWMQQLRKQGETVDIDFEEENPPLAELHANDVYASEIDEKIREAADWNPLADYGLENNPTDVDIEDIFLATMHSLTEGDREYGNTRYVSYIADALVDVALEADIKAMLEDPENGKWGEKAAKEEASGWMANREILDRFYELGERKNWRNQKEKFYRIKGDPSDVLAELNQEMGTHYNYLTEAEKEWKKRRAPQILEQAEQDPAIDEQLHKMMMGVVMKHSQSQVLENKREEIDTQWWEDYHSYRDGDPEPEYPERDEYETDEEFEEAQESYKNEYKEWEDNEAWNEEYARNEHAPAALAHQIYNKFVDKLAKNPLNFPKWWFKYKLDDRPSLVWLQQVADGQRAEAEKKNQTASNRNWYKVAQERQKGKSLAETGYPNKFAAIYRAVQNGVTTFNDMDYVTMSLKFAKEHADHNAAVNEEPSPVLRAVVLAENVFEAYNPGEYFYSGETVNGRVIYTAQPVVY